MKNKPVRENKPERENKKCWSHSQLSLYYSVDIFGSSPSWLSKKRTLHRNFTLKGRDPPPLEYLWRDFFWKEILFKEKDIDSHGSLWQEFRK